MTAIRVHENGQCPHCLRDVLFIFPLSNPGGTTFSSLTVRGREERIHIDAAHCPSCGKLIVTLTQRVSDDDVHEFRVWPLATTRTPVPNDVPAYIATDYNEAALILAFSPKASAALSRRCLQALLREQGYPQHDLYKQIEAVLPKLPSFIAEHVDAVRNIGNFAAHPMKSQASGEIVEVEPGEAEWNLDTLDLLFDFFYVWPKKARQKRDALNAKLQDANKPPMK